MNRIVGMLFKYRWELLLFIGIPLASDLITAVAVGFLNILLGFLFHASLFVHLVLMLLFYLRVRRLRRTTLTVVWGYGVAAIAVLIVVNIPLLSWIAEHLFERPTTISSITYWLLIAPIVSLATLVWFARRASRTSVSHGFLLVALSPALGGSIAAGYLAEAAGVIPVFDLARSVTTMIPLMIIRFGLACLAIVVLSQFDTASSRMRILSIAALICVVALSEVAEVVSYVGHIGDSLVWTNLAISIISNIGGSVMYFGIAFALVYLVRARNPNASEPPTNNAAAVQL